MNFLHKPPLSHSLIPLLFACVLLAAKAHAQGCVDPAVPPGGFAITEDTNLLWTWTDGAQTRVDVRYPSAAASNCGWPLVVLIHGGGGNKAVVSGLARSLAAEGFATLAYDVRGQGSAAVLNPPALAHDLKGIRQLLDLFEAIETAQSLYSGIIDPARTGVAGYSQGGSHSWWAAQHSGRIPPVNPWRTAPFPVIGAVAVRDSSAGISQAGEVFGMSRIEKLFGPSAITYQPAILAALRTHVLNEDYAAFAAELDVPGMDASTLLPLTAVPTLVHASYDDKKVPPSGVLAAYNLVPNATPKRLLLGTGGHGSPNNERDRVLLAQVRLRWFQRFLKGEMNGVDAEPRVFAAVTPDVLSAYLDVQKLWDFRTQDTLPDAQTVIEQRFLTSTGGFSSSLPAVPGRRFLNHTVPALVNMASFTTALPNANQLVTQIPLNSVDYTTDPLNADHLLQGSIEVTLECLSPTPDYQLSAVIVDVDPSGNERFVTSGATVLRQTSGFTQATISTSLQSYVFRSGNRLRLKVENMFIIRPPTGSAPTLKIVPEFNSALIAIHAGGAFASSIQIPWRPYVAPTLSTFPPVQSIGALSNQLLTLHSNSAQSGQPYLIVPSLAGSSPGTPYPGGIAPLNLDALSFAVIANPALPPFVNLLGTVGPKGSAEAGAVLAPLTLPPSFAGEVLTFAAIMGTTTFKVTNPVDIAFVP